MAAEVNGVIGHRSWIAQALIERLERDGSTVARLPKTPLADMSGIDELYVFPGRSEPTEDERYAEAQLVFDIANLGRSLIPRHLIFIGSSIVHENPSRLGTEKMFYRTMKLENEYVLGASYPGPYCIVRPPAIFGPGQSANSRMLLPTIAREGHDISLERPHDDFWMMHVDSFVEFLATSPRKTAGLWGPERAGAFRLTAKNLKELAETFMFYWGL